MPSSTRFDGDVWIYEQSEEWACHVQASIRCDEGGVATGLIDFGENVVAPAAVGAGVGAASAAITGGDPGMGALIGGGTGAIGGGLNWAGGGANPVVSVFGDSASPQNVATDLGFAPSGATGAAAPMGGISAAALAPPGGVSTGAGGGVDLTQPNVDPVAAGTQVPMQSQSVDVGGGKPDIPANQISSAAAGGGNTVLNAINDPSASNIMKTLGTNLGPIVAGGGLLANLISPQSGMGVNATNTLKGQADTLAGQGAQLSGYLMNGTLPPGAQQAIDLGTKSAKAHIRSQYAARGMSGSSAEVADLNNVDNVARTQAFDYANKLLQTGIDETGLSTKIYEALIGIDEKQSQQVGDAIANFSAALAGGFPIRRAA